MTASDLVVRSSSDQLPSLSLGYERRNVGLSFETIVIFDKGEYRLLPERVFAPEATENRLGSLIYQVRHVGIGSSNGTLLHLPGCED